MNTSLSFILPVCNAENTLAASVRHILEVLPELTPQFEVLIVDDGSTDSTPDIARELALCYPQVRTVRCPRPQGNAAAMRLGLEHAAGEVVLIDEGHRDGGSQTTRIRTSALQCLWRMRRDDQVISAKAVACEQTRSARIVHRVEASGDTVREYSGSSHSRAQSGLQMYRRDALRNFSHDGDSNRRSVPAPKFVKHSSAAPAAL